MAMDGRDRASADPEPAFAGVPAGPDAFVSPRAGEDAGGRGDSPLAPFSGRGREGPRGSLAWSRPFAWDGGGRRVGDAGRASAFAGASVIRSAAATSRALGVTTASPMSTDALPSAFARRMSRSVMTRFRVTGERPRAGAAPSAAC